MALRVEVNDPGEIFTVKERGVLALLCQGLLKKQMADVLCRSAKTIEKHIDQIHKKLDTHHPAATVATAVARGLVTISKLCLVYALCLGAVDLDVDARRPPARSVRVVRATGGRLREVVA